MSVVALIQRREHRSEVRMKKIQRKSEGITKKKEKSLHSRSESPLDSSTVTQSDSTDIIKIDSRLKFSVVKSYSKRKDM